MPTPVRCPTDRGWWPVSSRKQLEDCERAHADCHSIVALDGTIDDLPES